MTVGQPTSQPPEKRVGSASRLEADGRNTRAKKESEDRASNEPMAVINDEVMKEVTRAKRLRGVVSRPEYASEDDGMGALMTEATLYYAIQGKMFVDEAYALGNFRMAKVWARDVRRARVTASEIPAGQTPLVEYQQAYRRYINYRHKYRRDGEMMARKLNQTPKSKGNDEKQAARTDEVKKMDKPAPTGKWKRINGKWFPLHPEGGAMARRHL